MPTGNGGPVEVLGMPKKSERCRITWGQDTTEDVGRWKVNVYVAEPSGIRVPACGSSTHLGCL